jgi:hypothetical protein
MLFEIKTPSLSPIKKQNILTEEKEGNHITKQQIQHVVNNQPLYQHKVVYGLENCNYGHLMLPDNSR